MSELEQTPILGSKSNTYFGAAVYTEYIMLHTSCLHWRHDFITSLPRQMYVFIHLLQSNSSPQFHHFSKEL